MTHSALTIFVGSTDRLWISTPAHQHQLRHHHSLALFGRTWTHWYVPNVSIIFDVPCLFYIKCHMCLLCFNTILAYFIGLTYWQDAQCQFVFIMSVHCRKGPKFKVLRKIRKNYRNSISPENLGSQKDKSGRGPLPPGDPRRGPGLVARGPHLAASSTPSRRLFAYIFTLDLKTPEYRKFSPETHPSAAATENPNL